MSETETEVSARLRLENNLLRTAIREALTFQYGGVISSDGSAVLQDALAGKFNFNFQVRLYKTLCEIEDVARDFLEDPERLDAKRLTFALGALNGAIIRIEAFYPGVVPGTLEELSTEDLQALQALQKKLQEEKSDPGH